MDTRFIVLHDSFWKSLFQDAVTLAVIFAGLWLNHELGDSFFANCVLGALLFVFFSSGKGKYKHVRGVDELRRYADEFEQKISQET